MGKLKARLQEYEEYLDSIQPATIQCGIDALVHEYNVSPAFVRPVVEAWFTNNKEHF